MPLILSTLFGSGMQILALVVTLLGSTFAGSVSPLNFQVIQGLTLFLYPACGLINGFAAGRLYSFLHGTDWIGLWFVTSLICPLLFGLGFVAVDICEFIETGRA